MISSKAASHAVELELALLRGTTSAPLFLSIAAASDGLSLSCAELDDFALLELVERCGDPFGNAVSSGNQRSIGAAYVMSGRYASPNVPGNSRIVASPSSAARLPKVRRRSCALASVRPAASNKPAICFFKSALPLPSRFGKTHSLCSRGRVQMQRRLADGSD
jgi:hypothetical protein